MVKDNMKFFGFNISDDLKEWAFKYVAKKQIRGPKSTPSVGELIRRLLKQEMEKDKK